MATGRVGGSTSSSSSYDEDLSSNAFLLAIKQDFAELYAKVVEQRWVVCVPKREALINGRQPSEPLRHEEVAQHILVPCQDMPRTHFRSLMDRELRLVGDNTLVFNVDEDEKEEDKIDQVQAAILFRETFYTDDMHKHEVFCVDRMLSTPSQAGPETCSQLLSKTDCAAFLRSNVGGESFLRQVETLTRVMLNEKPELLQDPHAVDTHKLNEVLKELHLRVHDKALKNPVAKLHWQRDPACPIKLQLAVETCILDLLHDDVFARICCLTSGQDGELNGEISNLADLHFEHLDILPELRPVIGKARAEMAGMETARTPLDKMQCLSRCFRVLGGVSKGDGGALNSDDLLPAVIYVVLKAGTIRNWYAHLRYTEDFLGFSGDRQAVRRDEQGFNLSTLEAALWHIRSTELDACKAKALDKEMEESNLKEAHKLIKADDRKGISDALDAGTFMVQTMDQSKGYTPLHLACVQGKTLSVEVLLRRGASITARDHFCRTPLHSAAAAGHQNALLFLLQSEPGPDINARDSEGNTALHVACDKGHEACAKAILFDAEHRSRPLQLDGRNVEGDTPLHLAAAWGFAEIVHLLLEYHARTDLLNNHGRSAGDVAANGALADLIRSTDNSKNLNFFSRNAAPVINEEVLADESLFAAVTDPKPEGPEIDEEAAPKTKQPQIQIAKNLVTKDLTALHRAAAGGNAELTRQLLDEGASPLVHANPKEETPLHQACSQNHLDVVKVIASKDQSTLWKRDKEGNYPFLTACKVGATEVVQCLLDLECGCDLRKQENYAGNTASDLARAGDHEDVLELLEESSA